MSAAFILAVALLQATSNVRTVRTQVVGVRSAERERPVAPTLKLLPTIEVGNIHFVVDKSGTCVVDTIEVRQIEEFAQVESDDSVARSGLAALALGGLGLAGATAGFVVSAGQPPYNDQLPRDEISREQGFAASAIAGLVSLAVTGTGLLTLLSDEPEVSQGVREEEVVTATRPCSATTPEASVQVTFWDGVVVKGTTGTPIVLGRAQQRTPPKGTTWATANATVGTTIIESIELSPSPGFFLSGLRADLDAVQLENFRQRFEDTPAWGFLLEHYEALVRTNEEQVAAADVAAEKQRTANAKRLAAVAAAAVIEGNVAYGLESIREAARLDDAYETELNRISALAQRKGRPLLQNAIRTLRFGDLLEGERQLQLAVELGVEVPESVGDLRRAAAKRSLAKVEKMFAAGDDQGASRLLDTIALFGVEIPEDLRRAQRSARNDSMSPAEIERIASQLARPLAAKMERQVALSQQLINMTKNGYRTRACSDLWQHVKAADADYCNAVDDATSMLGRRGYEALARKVRDLVSYYHGESEGSAAYLMLVMSQESGKCVTGTISVCQ